jgi:hypothetical protein
MWFYEHHMPWGGVIFVCIALLGMSGFMFSLQKEKEKII